MEKYLKEKIRPFDPKRAINIEQTLIELQGCAFQGRNLGNALEILYKMYLDKECARILTLSGAMVPAGMEEVINQGIERGVFSAIVTTGANIIHSLVNSFEIENQQGHYIGNVYVDDAELHKLGINRIYDIYLPEPNYINAEMAIKNILLNEFGNGQVLISPSKLFNIIGKKLKGRSFLKIAADNNIPIFCGATSDSEFGLNLMRYRREGSINIILDEIQDIQNYAELILKYKRHGTIIIGGGVPRNWAQQIFPYLEQIELRTKSQLTEFREEHGSKWGFSYSVRIHTSTEYDGGLSGCTIEESKSWGKYKADSLHQSIWADATIIFPILMTSLFQRIDSNK